MSTQAVSSSPCPAIGTLVSLVGLELTPLEIHNGRYAVVISGCTEPSQVTVLPILAQREDYSKIDVQVFQLKVATPDTPNPILEMYVLAALWHVTNILPFYADTAHILLRTVRARVENLLDRPSILDIISLQASALHHLGKHEEILRLLRPVLASPLPEGYHAVRHRLRYSQVSALAHLGEVEDGLNYARSLLEPVRLGERGEAKDLCIEVLHILRQKAIQYRNNHRKDICEALLSVEPDDGLGLWDLAAFYAKKGQYAMAIEKYKAALDRGTSLSTDNKQILARDLCAARLQGNGVRGAYPGVELFQPPKHTPTVSHIENRGPSS